MPRSPGYVIFKVAGDPAKGSSSASCSYCPPGCFCCQGSFGIEIRRLTLGSIYPLQGGGSTQATYRLLLPSPFNRESTFASDIGTDRQSRAASATVACLHTFLLTSVVFLCVGMLSEEENLRFSSPSAPWKKKPRMNEKTLAVVRHPRPLIWKLVPNTSLLYAMPSQRWEHDFGPFLPS